MGVKEEGWSVLIWFCFQTTWCIRTIKISASHSLIALWVSTAGPAPGFGFLAVLPTLWGQVIYFGGLPCLRKPCFSECVSGVRARSKVLEDQRSPRSLLHWLRCCMFTFSARQRSSHPPTSAFRFLFIVLQFSVNLVILFKIVFPFHVNFFPFWLDWIRYRNRFLRKLKSWVSRFCLFLSLHRKII